MLAIDGGGDDGGRETGQRPDLDNPARRENAYQTSEEKIIPRTDAARITDVIEVHHFVKKFDFARRGDFSRMPQFLGQQAILDFKLLPVLKLADIETWVGSRQRIRARVSYFLGDLEAASRGGIPEQF